MNLGYVTTDNLQLHGYNTTFCKDGKAALEAFKKEPFDLCILDVMLPEMDGFELAKAIRERDKNVPIIFLTAKTLKEDKIAGFKTGADDYMTKPFSIEELLMRINVFLKRSKVNATKEELPSQFVVGKCNFDFDNLTLEVAKKKNELTKKKRNF